MVRSERSAAGTVEQAATPLISTASPASRPRNISPSSSAVERASVLIRQLWTILSPSKVARTVLVFPMSMHSSTGGAYPGKSKPFDGTGTGADNRTTGDPATQVLITARVIPGERLPLTSGQRERRSSAMSRIGLEWVSAPTER